jgi:ABC-2 type transport system permease protein
MSGAGSRAPEPTGGSGERIRALLRKELRELRKNKALLIAMAILPTIFVGLMIMVNVLVGRAPIPPPDKTRIFVPPAGLAGLTATLATQVLLNDQFMFMQLMIPVILPTVIAAHSVIGEKQARTLEPLLATPIRTWELLVAKTLAAMSPSVLLSWLAYGVSLASIRQVAGATVTRYLYRPLWSVGMLVVAPLLSLLSAIGTVIISSRVNDLRTAQAMAGVGVVPLLALGMSVLIGQRLLDTPFLVWSILVLVPLNLGLLWLATRLFRREIILTRWK